MSNGKFCKYIVQSSLSGIEKISVLDCEVANAISSSAFCSCDFSLSDELYRLSFLMVSPPTEKKLLGLSSQEK